jgi:hypothetical protein
MIKGSKNSNVNTNNRFDYFLNNSNEANEEVRLSNEAGSEKKENSPKKPVGNTKSNEDTFANTFINLTSRETFNNLIGTYSSITIILKSIYDKYYTDSQYAEMVDNLSTQSYSYPSCAMDKVRQSFNLSELPDSISDDFNVFTENNNTNDLE